MQQYRPADFKPPTEIYAVTQATHMYVICKFHNIFLLLVLHQNIPLTYTIHHN